MVPSSSSNAEYCVTSVICPTTHEKGSSPTTATMISISELVGLVLLVKFGIVTEVSAQDTTSGLCPADCGPPEDPITCDEMAARMPPMMASCEMLSEQCDCTGCEVCEPGPSTTPFTTVLPDCYGICGEGMSLLLTFDRLHRL